MKFSFHKLTAAFLAASIILLGMESRAQITVKVDSTKTWNGYLNVFTTNNGYVYGQGFGTTALRAQFVPFQTNATRVVLRINTNTYAPGTATPPDTNFWNFSDGTPNKHLEANFYVDVGTAYGGNTVTFEGTVESNTLPAGWTCEAVIKEFAPGYAYIGDTRAALVTGTPFSIMRTIPAGYITQYGFLMFGPNTAPGSPESLTGVSVVVDNADPGIVTQPVSQRVLIGGTATFTVAATGGSPLSYQWKRYTTNLTNGGNISGATSATLTISNAQSADATTYTVTVTDTAGSLDSQAAKLRVLTPEQFANLLDNPSFELDVPGPLLVPDPWINFSGSALLSDTEFPYTTAYDGTNVVQVYNAGQYNGVFQDVPAAPGQIFTGDCWLWQSSSDPLLAPTNEAFLEVQFWPVAGAPIAIYHSILVTNDAAMLDAWLHLEATNGVPAGYASTSTSNAKYLIAPAGTDRVRFQITSHAEGGGSGSVFADAMRLLKKVPVTVSAYISSGNINLSWPSQVSSDYQVVYKNNLTDATWTPIGGIVTGDGTTKSASYPTAGDRRFYAVLTL